jgi:hypothetical protein
MEPMSMSEPTSSVLPEAAVSEADFLQRQSEQAQAAIANALANARAALAEGVDPREWARRYPIIAIGSAAVAGFAAAVMTIPSKEQQEIHRLEKIKEALHPHPAPPKNESNGKSAEHQSVWMTLLHEAVQLIRPVLTSVLFANIGGPSSSAPPSPGYGTTSPGADVHDNTAGR